MSKKLLFRLVVLLMTMMCALGAAAAEAYANYTPSNTTLTFYYDNQRSSRSGTTYDLNTGYDWPGWRDDGNNANVTRVVFDSSFAGARPTSTHLWFGDMVQLTTITGMKQYLNTSSVTHMSAMFYWCKAMTSFDLSGFNTAQVKYMDDMFMGCSNLRSLDLSGFNTAQVTDMVNMFNNCRSLTSLDLSNFNTAQVIYMDYMFIGCSGLTNLDLSSFNTAKVTSMYSMFCGCSSLTSLDLSSFNPAQLVNTRYMFQDCSGLATIYAGSGWSTATVTYSGDMFMNCTSLVGGQGTTYNSSHVDATYAHIDGGPSNPGYFTEWKEAFDWYTPSYTTLTFYYDNQRSSRTGTTYDLNTGGRTPVWRTDGTNANVTKVVFNSSFAGARPTTTYYWFEGMQNLTSITGISYLNTEDVTIMGLMFDKCAALTSLDLSNFNTSNVVNMDRMFSGCSGLTSLDLSSFNTANVKYMGFMFYNCSGLTSLDVTGFNTAKVIEMNSMFSNCTGLTSLDLSNFNTANVTTMRAMFDGCTNLTTIYAGSGWTTDAVTMSNNMFGNCISLVGGQGTTYSSSHVDKAYAHIDGGTSNPGYFTEKNAGLRGDVNGDGSVNISDVTALIDYLLSGNASGINLTSADCNQDSSINISDVTALIDYLLSNHW